MKVAFRLLVITDGRVAADLVGTVARALTGAPAGTVAVMLRDKDLEGRARLALARRLRRVTADAGALFLVNDRADVALEAAADGVHLPAAGMSVADARKLLGPDGLVGVSTHGDAEVRANPGADYLTFGPIFDTPSKRAFGAPVGLDALAAAAKGPVPLFGLGGVDLESAEKVLAAGAAGIACVRAVLGAPDPARAVEALLAAPGLR